MASTDPTPFIVSAIDLQKGETALYIRGNDMENFPSKEVVSAIMPIKLLPYSAGISSSQLRRSISRSNSGNDGSPDDKSFNSSGRGTELSDQGDSSISTSIAGNEEYIGDGDVFDEQVDLQE